MTRNLSTQTAIILTSVITVNVCNVIDIVTSISIMDSSNIEDEEENINVSGRLAFDHSESVEGDKNLDDNVPTLSEHFNLNRSDKEENPIFETGKTWFSKLSSSATYTASVGRRKSSSYQSMEGNDIVSKPIGHWPDLWMKDKNEPLPTSHHRKLNGKSKRGRFPANMKLSKNCVILLIFCKK